MSARVICISRTLGAGGEAVGQLVSHRLGFRYLDEEIISLAAEKAQVDQRLVANAEHRQTILARLMDAIAERGSLQPSSYFKQSRDSSDYVRSTNLPVANLRSDLKWHLGGRSLLSPMPLRSPWPTPTKCCACS